MRPSYSICIFVSSSAICTTLLEHEWHTTTTSASYYTLRLLQMYFLYHLHQHGGAHSSATKTLWCLGGTPAPLFSTSHSYLNCPCAAAACCGAAASAPTLPDTRARPQCSSCPASPPAPPRFQKMSSPAPIHHSLWTLRATRPHCQTRPRSARRRHQHHLPSCPCFSRVPCPWPCSCVPLYYVLCGEPSGLLVQLLALLFVSLGAGEPPGG